MAICLTKAQNMPLPHEKGSRVNKCSVEMTLYARYTHKTCPTNTFSTVNPCIVANTKFKLNILPLYKAGTLPVWPPW